LVEAESTSKEIVTETQCRLANTISAILIVVVIVVVIVVTVVCIVRRIGLHTMPVKDKAIQNHLLIMKFGFLLRSHPMFSVRLLSLIKNTAFL